jgi:hypothetical protein
VGVGTIIWAMPTLGLRSPRLGVARRVVPYQWFAHPGLVPIGHECSAG